MGYIKINIAIKLELVVLITKKGFEFMNCKYIYFKYGYIYEINLTET